MPLAAVTNALRIATELEAREIPYAIGGAIAWGIWAAPRGTVDVDLDVFVDSADQARVIDALIAAGVELDIDEATVRAVRDGMYVGRLGGMRIDVFLPCIPFYAEAERTRVRLSTHGQPAWYLSAETTCVFKLLFFRGKDIVDLERLIAVQGPRLDHAYVRRWMVEMMGEYDERVVRWDQLVRDFGDGV